MPRVVGFTGTQKGMSKRQKESLKEALSDGVTELHHGDCIGADAQADTIARELGIDVVIHPPINALKRAFCAKAGDVVWEPAPYLERDHDIVDETEELIAAPHGDKEELRSGTWATIRYARQLDKTVTILRR
jgi:hypothetical protein